MIYFTRTPGVSPKKVTRHVTLEVKMNIHPTVHRSHPKAEVPSNEALLLGKRWSWELVSMVELFDDATSRICRTILLWQFQRSFGAIWPGILYDIVWYCSFFQDPTHNDLQWSLNTSSWSYWVTPSERLWGTLSRLGFLSGCINTCHIPNKWINSCITLHEEKKGLQITMCLMIMVRSWTNTKKG